MYSSASNKRIVSFKYYYTAFKKIIYSVVSNVHTEGKHTRQDQHKDLCRKEPPCQTPYNSQTETQENLYTCPQDTKMWKANMPKTNSDETTEKQHITKGTTTKKTEK
jgi:hypothetical protein